MRGNLGLTYKIQGNTTLHYVLQRHTGTYNKIVINPVSRDRLLTIQLYKATTSPQLIYHFYTLNSHLLNTPHFPLAKKKKNHLHPPQHGYGVQDGTHTYYYSHQFCFTFISVFFFRFLCLMYVLFKIVIWLMYNFF